MKISVYNQEGKDAGEMTLPKEVFDIKINSDLVHQVFVSQMSNMRQNSAHTKNRGEVRGGGRKPWKQKGTGRARHGSNRSPIWVGGGVAHGPTKDVNFKKKISKTMGRSAFASALSSRVKEGHLLVVDDIAVTSAKTKDAVSLISSLSKQMA